MAGPGLDRTRTTRCGGLDETETMNQRNRGTRFVWSFCWRPSLSRGSESVSEGQHHSGPASASASADLALSSSPSLQENPSLRNRSRNKLPSKISPSALWALLGVAWILAKCHCPPSHETAATVTAPMVGPLAVSAFRATPPTAPTRPGRGRDPPCRLGATLSWLGDAQASVEIPPTGTSSPTDPSLQEWLGTPAASDLALLGTPEPTPRRGGSGGDGSTVFECRQPVVDFLGLELQPVFLHEIDRRPPPPPETDDGRGGAATVVTVTILEARVEIPPSKPNLANRGVRRIMEQAQFQGRAVITAVPASGPRTNDPPPLLLSVDLTLTLTVELPPYLPVPPGFNRIGSAIMRRAGTARSQQLLEDMKQHYENWKSNQTR
jgi:hypothetical protein